MKFDTFSQKQLAVLTWWNDTSELNQYRGIICDGSVRSGKTLSMSMSFVMWAMYNFDGVQFGISGKSVSSVERNIIFWLVAVLSGRGYKVQYKGNCLIVSIYSKKKKKKITNYFYVFGGKDKASYTTIQGLTAGGWLFDEVALQPEEFVNQAMTRCSIEGRRFFWNCNPEGPMHWFKTDFIDMAKEKKFLHIHFLMQDNPSLTQEMIDDYETTFKGTFYLRYIKGMWVLAEGIIFDSFDYELNTYTEEEMPIEKKIRTTRYLAVDYGIANPFAVLDIYDAWDVAYVDEEIYYDSSKKNIQLTDEHYLNMIKELDKSNPIIPITAIVIDPSALSLIVLLRNQGYRVKPADNDVLEGIKVTHSAFHQRKLMVNKRCVNFINELNSYVWDDKARERGEEKPLKINDHACVDEDTLIHSRKSKYKIKQLTGGSLKKITIPTYDKGKMSESELSEVVLIGDRQCYKIKTDDGGELIATPDHRIYTKYGYKELEDINIGDEIVKATPLNLNDSLKNKYEIKISRIIEKEDIGKRKVYDATVLRTHNYICDNGFISHNCDCARYFVNTIMKKRILKKI